MFAVFHHKLSGVLVSQVPVIGGKYIASIGGIGVEFVAGFSSLLLQERKTDIELISSILILII
jgi:hypothetical protein